MPVLDPRARDRVVVVAAPAVLAHHEQPHGWDTDEPLIVALKRGVEPAQVLHVQTSGPAEVGAGGVRP
jgi:hypothetical protein